MTALAPTADRVKRANRRLYDAVGERYETIDGRREPSLAAWIRGRLAALAMDHGSGVLLDLGSGSGVVTRAASGLFSRTIALDLSPGILASAAGAAEHRIAADVDALPVADASADVVTSFAVLHHLYDTAALAREVGRVLRPGGVYWSDHDMDATFYRRFRWPLAMYRRMRRADRRYAEAADIDAETYALAEVRENGVAGRRFADQLFAAGLQVRTSYHWFGLSSVTNRLFGRRTCGRGWGPLVSIVAVKIAQKEPPPWPASC